MRSAGAEAIGQQVQAAAHERQLVVARHRARHVDQEDQVAAATRRRRSRSRDIRGPHADEGQQVILVPRAGADLGRDRDRRVAGRRRVVEAEVVDELLDADRAFGRQASFAQHPPDVGVGRGVDVGRERRAGARRNAMEAALRQVLVGLPVELDRLPLPPAAIGREAPTGTVGLDRQGAARHRHGLGQRADFEPHGKLRRPTRDHLDGLPFGLEPRKLDRDGVRSRQQPEHVELAALVRDGRRRRARGPP